MRIGVIVQARMSSSRLPGKVLMTIADQKILDHIIKSYSKIEEIDKIIIATSEEDEDYEIVKFVEKQPVEVFRGSLVDVLDRFWKSSTIFDLDIIIRHTADNIFIDLERVSEAIRIAKNHTPNSIFLISSRKQLIPIGMDIEVFSKGALELANKSAISAYDREHVTPYLYESPLVDLVQLKVDLANEYKDSVPSCTIDTFTDLSIAEDYARWLGKKLPTFENCYEWWRRR